MSSARLALAAARPYVSAAVNTGGGRQALRVLELIDKALKEFRDAEQPSAPIIANAQGEWEPPGGWPAEE